MDISRNSLDFNKTIVSGNYKTRMNYNATISSRFSEPKITSVQSEEEKTAISQQIMGTDHLCKNQIIWERYNKRITLTTCRAEVSLQSVAVQDLGCESTMIPISLECPPLSLSLVLRIETNKTVLEILEGD